MAWTDPCFVILAVTMSGFSTRLAFGFPVAAGLRYPGILAQGTWQVFLLGYTFIAFGDFISPPHCVNHKEMGQK